MTFFQHHDHDTRSDKILERIEWICRTKDLRLTPVRRRVLEILLERHRAMGAYELLEQLGANGFGRQPPVVYRALDFLIKHGFVHRVQRVNAFAACLHPGEEHSPVFMICKDCNAIAEATVSEVRAALDCVADGMGFEIERVSLEAIGVCPICTASTGISE